MDSKNPDKIVDSVKDQQRSGSGIGVHYDSESVSPLLQSVLDVSSEGICVIDEDGIINRVNAGFCDMFGYRETEVIGRDVRLLFNERDRDSVMFMRQELPVSGEVREGDFAAMSKTGEKLAVRLRARLLVLNHTTRVTIFYVRDDTRLKKTEQYYRNIFDFNPIPNLIFDMLTLNILDVNQKAVEHYGYSREEFPGMTIGDILCEEDVAKWMSMVNKLTFQKGVGRIGTYTHMKKDGTRMRVDITGHRLVYEGRECMSVVCNDVTHQEDLVARLQRSNEQYKLVSLATNDAVYDMDVKTNTLQWGEGLKRTFGHSPDESVCDLDQWSSWIHPEDQDVTLSSFNAFLKNQEQEKWSVEYRLQRADGTYAFVEEQSYVIRDDDGKAIRLIGSIKDIDEKKRAEIAFLEAIEDRVDTLESISDAFYAVDEDWSITYFNKEAGRLLHVAPEHMLGKKIWDAFPTIMVSVLFEKFQSVLENQETESLEQYYPPMNAWYNVTVYPSKGGGLAVYFRDITESMEHINAIEEQNKRLRQIAWTQSHVLRAPLARLMGLADMITSGMALENERDQILQHIQDSAKEMDGIVKDIVSKTENIDTESKSDEL